ncbi:MAG: permease [Bacteroidota bacterium]
MEKTFGLLLMIGLGVALKMKIKHPDQLKGIKVLILSLALPATIFVALLKVDLRSDLLVLPLLGLFINLILFFFFQLSLPLFPGLSGKRKRTLLMLLPSLAPGLSCFPFISEYLGDEPLAFAALVDVGNKFFVLIVLYILSMRWFLKLNSEFSNGKNGSIQQMILKMFSEPINMVMIVALFMLGLNLNLDALPESISSVFLRLSSIMAPLVLLFIGLAVKIKLNQIGNILQFLSWRSGLSFIISAIFIYFIPDLSSTLILLAVVFPQSSCSFWPFAHMTLVNDKEKSEMKTFEIDFALQVLACSLPFSSLVIMGSLSFPVITSNPTYLVILGSLLLTAAFIPRTIIGIRKLISKNENVFVKTS